MRPLGMILTLITVAVGLGVPTAVADSAIRPALPCAALQRDFAITGAVAHVTQADEVRGTAEPDHCDLHGHIDPAVGFQLRLPLSTFAGRYLQYGCGGPCGFQPATPFPRCGTAPGGDFAVAATDDGHLAPTGDDRWAQRDQAARDDWFFRAPHVLSLAAKKIIATFYGGPPRRSYFSGCSTGGREGLLLAQRYPNDFDGITAGAPTSYLGPLAIYHAWMVQANTAADGSSIITRDKLPVLHNRVIAACDGLDGLIDGQLDDPRACTFDPVGLLCPAGDGPDCLTTAQVEAARKLYAGPTDERGRKLYPANTVRGSELNWDGWIVPLPGLSQGFSTLIFDGYLRYIGYPIGTPHSSITELQFTDADFNRLVPEGLRGNAMSLDLRAFRRAGSKLILWHGFADNAIPPGSTVDYYARLVDRAGGLRETQGFARLFMVPSLYHCAGGERLTEFDPLGAIVDWVERRQAPDRIIATGRDAANNVVRTRPVFPYPLRARYDGSGSIDDAANFLPALPRVMPQDAVDWVGTGLYNIPGPVAP
jgi:tannase/feruloyl esterase